MINFKIALSKRKQIIQILIFMILITVLYYILMHSQFVNIWRVKKAIKRGRSEEISHFLAVDDRYVQLFAVRGLGEIRDEMAITELIRVAHSSSFFEVQIGSIKILGKIKTKQSLEGLVTTLDLGDRILKINAIREITHLINQPFHLPGKKEEQDLIISELKRWWKENQDYLLWAEKENYFVIDEEAKAAGIPTEEYRKTHPWPGVDAPDLSRPEPDSGDLPRQRDGKDKK